MVEEASQVPLKSACKLLNNQPSVANSFKPEDELSSSDESRDRALSTTS
jgi:hypothetical protein